MFLILSVLILLGFGGAFLTPSYDLVVLRGGGRLLVIQPRHYTPEAGTQHLFYYALEGEPQSEQGWFDLGNIPYRHAMFWDMAEAQPGIRYLALQQRDAQGRALGSWTTDTRWLTRITIREER